MKTFDPQVDADLEELYKILDSFVAQNLGDAEITERLCKEYQSQYIFSVVHFTEKYIY